MRVRLCIIGAMIAITGCATTEESVQTINMDDETAASRALVLDFFDKVLLGGDLALADQFLRDDYIQHNPQIPGGLDGFVSYFTAINNRLETMNATITGDIEHVIAERDKVMVVVRYQIKGPIEVNFRAADLFRVQDGLIAEHWDVRQGDTVRDHQILMQN